MKSFNEWRFDEISFASQAPSITEVALYFKMLLTTATQYAKKNIPQDVLRLSNLETTPSGIDGTFIFGFPEQWLTKEPLYHGAGGYALKVKLDDGREIDYSLDMIFEELQYFENLMLEFIRAKFALGKPMSGLEQKLKLDPKNIKVSSKSTRGMRPVHVPFTFEV